MSKPAPLPPLQAKVRLYHDASGKTELLGFADLTIADAFVIKGIRVLMGKPKEDKPGEPFISFPARKAGGAANARWFEVAHPLSAECRLAARETVLRAYQREARKTG